MFHAGLRNRASVISLSLAIILVLAAQSQAVVVAYWKFEQGANFLKDSSGNGHDLTAAPNTLYTAGGPAAGTEGTPTASTDIYSGFATGTYSASFGGTDSLITVDTLGLNSYSAITVEWMMKEPTVPSERYPWFSGNPADINGATGDFSFATQGVFRDFGATNLSTSITAGEWHEYALTLDKTGGGTGMKLYKDYTLVDSTGTAAVSFLNTTFVIGKDYYGGSGVNGRNFTGFLDDVRISSGVLSTDQFLNLQTVPEPASVGVMVILASGMMSMRRRMSRSN